MKSLFSVLILAGGKSSRMGYPKPWLKTSNGDTFLKHIISTYKKIGVSDIVVVLNEKFATSKWENELNDIDNNISIIINNQVAKGRLFSVKLGLNQVKSDKIFIHNVDNPFVESKTLNQLTENLETDGITIPTCNWQGGHPVIITKSVREEIINNHQNYDTLKDVFFEFPRKYIEMKNSYVLKNINTPKDLEVAFHELV